MPALAVLLALVDPLVVRDYVLNYVLLNIAARRDGGRVHGERPYEIQYISRSAEAREASMPGHAGQVSRV